MAKHEIKEITLTGTFKEMGQQYAEKLAAQILEQLQLYQKYIVPENPAQANFFKQREAAFLKAMTYPEEMHDFMDGILESLEYLGGNCPTKDDLLRLDQMLMLSKLSVMVQSQGSAPQESHCSVIAMRKDGAVGVGRNFDWTNKIIKPFTDNPLVVHFRCTQDGYNTEAIGVGYVGMCSFPTLITEHGYMAVNSAAHNMDKAHQDVPPGRPYYLAEMVIAATRAKSYDDLQNFAMNTATDYGFMISLAGPRGELACVEASPYVVDVENGFKNRLRGPSGKDDVSKNTLIVTNLYELPDWEQFLGIQAPEDTLSHSNARNENLHIQALARYEDINKNMLKKFGEMMEMGLNEGARLGPTQYFPGDHDFKTPTVTHYSVALRFKPEKSEPLRAKVRFAQQEEPGAPALQSEWHKIKYSPRPS